MALWQEEAEVIVSADLVVGEVGFGPHFASEDANLRVEIAALESEVAELIRQRNRLRRVLERCAALSPDISNEKHEALLQTDPRNIHNKQKIS
jgi:hypothetical protein